MLLLIIILLILLAGGYFGWRNYGGTSTPGTTQYEPGTSANPIQDPNLITIIIVVLVILFLLGGFGMHYWRF
jgi:hypothetical protein